MARAEPDVVLGKLPCVGHSDVRRLIGALYLGKSMPGGLQRALVPT